MLKTTLRGLLAHKLRLSLAGFAVVLGVAFISGTLVLGDTINSVFDTLFANTTAGVDVAVRGVATQKAENQTVHPPIPDSLLATVQRVDGVKEAAGELDRNAEIIGRDGKIAASVGAPSLGLLWNPYPDLTAFTLRSGSAPHGATEIVIDAHTAAAQGLRVGDQVRILLPKGGVQTFRVAGTTGFGSQDNIAGATAAVFDYQAGRAILGSPAEFDQIVVKGRPGVTADALRSRVAAALPQGAEAITGQSLAREQTDQVKTGIGFLTTFLLVFAFISLFVGSFIILNTFSILIAQRTRELALLRCLGASRGQVMRSVLLEATITGFIASLVGLGAGLLIAKGLEALLSTIGLDLGTASLQLQARTVVVSLAVGTLLTVVASVVPARRATRVAPVEALRESAPAVSAVTPARIAIGSAILLVGVVGMLAGLLLISSNQLLVTGVSAVATVVGVATLAPIIVVPVMSGLGAPVRRTRGVPGRLAQENAMRQPRRTASTASALMIGVAVVSCFTVVAASLTDSINRVVDRSVNADYIVSPQSQGGQGLPPDVSTRIASDPAVGVVSPIAIATFRSGGEDLRAEGVEPSTILAVVDIPVRRGAQISALTDGDVAISEDAAKSRSLDVGGVIPMQFARPGVHRQRVASVYARNPLLGDYVLTRRLAEQTGIQTNDVVVLVTAASGTSQAQLRNRLNADLAGLPSVQVQNNQEYKDSQASSVNVLLNLLTTLVVLAIVIALLGVVNTMALSILERVRELGLVRALGMTRGQTRSMVRWETVLVTVFGALLGCVVGVFFGIALVRAFASQGVDVLNLALGRQVFYVVVAFGAGLVAAIWPARRAARVDMLRAIVTE